MSVVVLDTGPLGMIVHPGGDPEVDACQQWLDDLLAQNRRIILPEVADYEVRRELIRMGKSASLAALDNFAFVLEYLPLTTGAMRLAADLWAQSRQQGRPTADPKELDGDVILAAQALLLNLPDVVVATTNVGHIARYVSAKRWRDVT
jgi:predicted nucleic acid-binding protein